MADNREHVRRRLLQWFKRTKRQLPWRDTYDPYHVWISEIMLQQTQMDRGVVYFKRWLARFPTLAAVAEASEQEILKQWEGLGYYARARNLHRAAKHIVRDYDGEVPCDYQRLLTLPGIGPYTAAAISSIACNADIAVVDANVLRVYARLFDIEGPVRAGAGRKQVELVATAMLPPGKARLFNQALMDFGGLICTPKAPDCGHCPVQPDCLAYRNNTVSERPAADRGKGTTLIEMVTGILASDGRLFIQQRNRDDIWGGLWEFPGGRLEPGEQPQQALIREYLEETGFRVCIDRELTTVIHFYTRYKVVLHCFTVTLADQARQPVPRLTAASAYRWVRPESLADFGFPAGHRKLLEYIGEHCPELLAAL